MTAYIASRPDGKICLIGAPFDSTSSFHPGARFGPKAIRDASHSLETFSYRQQADLADCPFMDKGDLELPFGDPQAVLPMIEESIKEIHTQEKFPFLLGGEHLVSLGAVTASAHVYENLKVIQLDAHADLRENYMGQRLSHATVMRRISDVVGLDSIRQIGIRSCTKDENRIVKQVNTSIEEILSWAGSSPCYVTCDLDILDPSVLPGTGTPEPGGMSFQELISLLLDIIRQVNVVATDVVELVPNVDISGVSSVVAAKVVRECLIALCEQKRR